MTKKCEHLNEEIYDIWNAPRNTKLYKNELLRYKHLLKLFPKSTQSVLDLGCGTGFMAYLLAQKGYDVTAIDISETRLQHFSKIAKKHSIKQIHTDFFTQTFSDFDAIISQEVLEHLENHEEALNKAYSFTRFGGYAIFCVPYKENLKAKTKKCPICGAIYHTSGHLHSFDSDKLINSLKKAGFSIISKHLIVNKRTVKWLALSKLPICDIIIFFDGLMNKFFPFKASYLAVLCKKG